ncbi:unnamed protein product [Diplocarpon coronariae]
MGRVSCIQSILQQHSCHSRYPNRAKECNGAPSPQHVAPKPPLLPPVTYNRQHEFLDDSCDQKASDARRVETSQCRRSQAPWIRRIQPRLLTCSMISNPPRPTPRRSCACPVLSNTTRCTCTKTQLLF